LIKTTKNSDMSVVHVLSKHPWKNHFTFNFDGRQQ